MFPFLITPQDITAEAKALIEKYRKAVPSSDWQSKLGKDLAANYLSRLDFIRQVFNQLSSISLATRLRVLIVFLESISIKDITTLFESKTGTLLLTEMQIWIDPLLNPDPMIGIDKRRSAYMKIESIRIPKIVNDKRPYMGDMVSADEDLGIDPSTNNTRAAYSYRFGAGHDGEHWLTRTVGAEIKAIPGITGTILTYYAQNTAFTLWDVMVLLDNTRLILVLKDLADLGIKIKQALVTGTGTGKTAIFDSKGNPLSKTRLNAGDLIGRTTEWQISPSARVYYPHLSGISTVGTFHFAFIKQEAVQQYRNISPKATLLNSTGATSDEQIAKMTRDEKKTAIAVSWFVPVLSPQVPVKCFK